MASGLGSLCANVFLLLYRRVQHELVTTAVVVVVVSLSLFVLTLPINQSTSQSINKSIIRTMFFFFFLMCRCRRTRAGWVELEEDDTIFKCVSVLQARAPPPMAGSSPPSASSAGSARGHSLMEGLMGLKR